VLSAKFFARFYPLHLEMRLLMLPPKSAWGMKAILTVLFFVFAASQAEASCRASASRSWGQHKIEASAAGPNCANAVLTLVVRADDNYAVWTKTYVADQLMNFSDSPAANAAAMKAKLKDWISGDGFMKTADQLQTSGEFPFTPAGDLNPGTMEDAVKNRSPVFCFIQGSESGQCLAEIWDGEVVELGVQAFPG